MIAIHRVESVVIRHLYTFRRSFSRLSDAIYMPVMDLVLWGVTIQWISQRAGMLSDVLLVMLTAIVFWQIVFRANYEIAVNLLEELWSQNLTNLFATPLKVGEWIGGVMLVGVLKTFFTIIIGLTTSWILYSLNIFSVGYMIVPFIVSLIMFGWSLGFFASGLIIYFGTRIQTLAWSIVLMLAPFSAVYYPLDALPGWAQAIGSCLPTSYVFEGMRMVLNEHKLPLENLMMAACLNILYLVAALWFFLFMFEKARGRGLNEH